MTFSSTYRRYVGFLATSTSHHDNIDINRYIVESNSIKLHKLTTQ